MGHPKIKKAEFREHVKRTCLVLLASASMGFLVMGCQSTLPAASDETASSPCPGPATFNNCQSLTANGTWNATCGTTCTSVLALSPYYATAGKYSLDAAITSLASISGGGYDNDWLQLNGFAAVNWQNYPQMIIDMTVDRSVVAGATYSNFALVGSTGNGSALVTIGGVTKVVSQYYSVMSSNSPVVVAGTQSVTLDIDLTNSGSTIPPSQGTNINMLYFVYSRSAPSGSQGTGNIYLGDIRLTQNCP